MQIPNKSEPKPDFDKLRKERDESVNKAIDEICAKQGWDRSNVGVHVSPSGCYCACPTGPCEHEFGGWREVNYEEGGGYGEQFCQKCGMGSMNHSMRTCEF